MESCFPGAKNASISSEGVDIENWFVVFGHRAIGNVMPRLECVRFVEPKLPKAVVWRRLDRKVVLADKWSDVRTGGWISDRF